MFLVSHHSLDGIRMDRFALGFGCFISFSLLVGCGSDAQVAQDSASPAHQVAAPAASTPAPVPGPTDVVSQFLDEIRRGGEDTRAHTLLTSRAQSELKRIGQTIQPIGSPSARFEVTRFELHPEDDTAAMVHSIWSEPNADGSTMTASQVVWALRQESACWRISGLAISIDPNTEDLVVFNFEDGNQMASMLAEPGSDQAEVSSQAESPGTTLKR